MERKPNLNKQLSEVVDKSVKYAEQKLPELEQGFSNLLAKLSKWLDKKLT
jgi:hypothetical protein